MHVKSITMILIVSHLTCVSCRCETLLTNPAEPSAENTRPAQTQPLKILKTTIRQKSELIFMFPEVCLVKLVSHSDVCVLLVTAEVKLEVTHAVVGPVIKHQRRITEELNWENWLFALLLLICFLYVDIHVLTHSEIHTSWWETHTIF